MSARAPRSSSPTRSRPWRWRAATWCSRAPTSARRAHCSPGRWDSWPRSDPRMKKVLVLLIVLALAGAGYWYFALRTGSGSVPGVQYRTGKVERGELIEGVAASGTVQPVVLVQVGTQISGAIEKLFADFNSQVKAGQTIAPLDSRRLAAQVTSDEAAVARAVEVGQTVAASLQAPTLFLIAQDLTKVQVQVSVPEPDIGKIHKGQRARFSVDAYSDKSFEGTVSQVRLASTTVQNVVTYTVVVDASNPDGLLFPGMTASLTFEIARSSKDALHVPATALRLQPAAELVDAHVDPRRTGPALEWPIPARWHRRGRALARQARGPAQLEDRVRVPVLQPAAAHQRRRERRAAALLRARRQCAAAPRARARGARTRPVGRPGASPPEPALGRPAAARGHRAGARQPALAGAGRRADRQPRQQGHGRDHGPLAGAQRCGQQRGLRHARARRGAVRQAQDRAARRA